MNDNGIKLKENIQLLINIGNLKSIGADEPVYLNKPDVCHYVNKGILNIYYTVLNNEGIAGRRYFLATAKPGDMLFSCYNSPVTLIAVPEFGSEIITLKSDNVFIPESNISSSVMSEIYESWVSLLLRAINFPVLPVKGKVLDNGDKQVLAARHLAYSPEKMSWLQVNTLDSEIKIFGCVPLKEVEKDYYFPLIGNVWVAADKEFSYNIKTTSELIAESRIKKTLDYFQNYFLRNIEGRIKQETEYESDSLQKVYEVNNKSLFHIRSKIRDLVIGKKSSKVRAGANNSSNMLFSACQIVGDNLGITFKEVDIPQNCQSIDRAVSIISELSNIKHRKILFSDKWWKGDSGPILAFLKDSMTPVAIIPFRSGSRYKVINLKEGKEFDLTAKTAQQISQFGYTFYRPLPHRELRSSDLIKYCCKGMFVPILFVLLIGCLGSLIGLLTPVLTEKIVNHAIPKSDLFQLKQIAAILIATAVAGVLFSLTKSLIMLRFTSKIDSSLEAALLDRLFSLPIPFYRKFLAGDLAQRCLGIRSIRTIFSSSVISSILGAVFSVFYLGLCFYYSCTMAVVGFIATIIFSVFYLCSGILVTKKFMRPMLEITGKMQGRLLQFVSEIIHLRMTSSENRALSSLIDDYSDYAELQKKSSLIQSGLGIVSYVYPTITTILFFYLIGKNIVKNVNIGEFMAFTAAYSSFQTAILHLTTPFLGFAKLGPILRRAKPILDEIPEVNESSMDCPEITGNIEIVNLKFRYSPELPFVLNDVTIKIEPGQYVAIVGTSGSGKSTLMRIMLGFDNPESGSIFYSQNELSKINKKELRKQMGVVLQNSKLINASIYENIVGGSTLPVDAAWEAAKMAGVADEINEMPMGMHTVVGVGTGGLSGGQAQRVLIARALVRKPKILFFDEATSALDNKTQALVTESLEKLSVTRIAIAHRLSTIINADVIYVLDKGQIIQKGNFNDLMEDKEGLFYTLASRQMV